MARYLIGNVKGPKGEDGFSPVATVTQTTEGATISVTDATGTTTANIKNGESRSDYDLAVQNGYSGTPAEWLESLKGISPTASVAQSGDNAVITVTDAAGTTSATISAGGSYRAGEGIDITDGVISVTDAIDIDLSDYATIDYVVNLVGQVEQEMDTTYTAGSGIEISENNVVSVDTDTIATKNDLDNKQDTLSAGVGININNNTVAVDTSAVATKSELFSGNYNDLTNKPDLSSYAIADDVNQSLEGKQDELTVGANISIVNNVISATDTTYTAGTGIDITNNVISATGGGGSGSGYENWEDDCITVTHTAQAELVQDLNDWVSEYQNGHIYMYIKYNDTVYYLKEYPTMKFGNTGHMTVFAKYMQLVAPQTDSHHFEIDYDLVDQEIYSAIYAGNVYQPEVPTIHSTDIGKVLTVGQAATAVWQTPESGGTTYTAGAGIDITNDEISVDNTVALKSELFSGDYDDLTNKPVIPDISGLATTAALTAGLATKQDTLTAGDGITIDRNNVISASGGSVSDPIEFESEPEPDSGAYTKTSMGSENSFDVSYFDGTHENPETDAYMVSDSVGASRTTFDDREQTETTTETYINPEGINFKNDGNGYSILLGRDGLDIYNTATDARDTIAVLSDIPEGVPAYGVASVGKVLGVVDASVSRSAEGPLRAPAATPELAWVEPASGGITSATPNWLTIRNGSAAFVNQHVDDGEQLSIKASGQVKATMMETGFYIEKLGVNENREEYVSGFVNLDMDGLSFFNEDRSGSEFISNEARLYLDGDTLKVEINGTTYTVSLTAE